MVRAFSSHRGETLNESPSEKEGKYGSCRRRRKRRRHPSMKVPPKRKGNFAGEKEPAFQWPSMKVPPKRKGNLITQNGVGTTETCLNESPYEKVGKCGLVCPPTTTFSGASMKVPTKK